MRCSTAFLPLASCFCPGHNKIQTRHVIPLSEKGKEYVDSYETSNAYSRGFVSSLTDIINVFLGENKNDDNKMMTNLAYPVPQSPIELMSIIEQDYTEKNYLWTGDIYLAAFEPECTFTDPTLTFQGRQQYETNMKNLVPIVDFLTNGNVFRNDDTKPRSELLDISLNEEEGYVETRWNMIGELSKLPWKPMIDVIGRTKFWYKETEEGCRVYFYDEKWEMDAGAALLQLLTPNSISSRNR